MVHGLLGRDNQKDWCRSAREQRNGDLAENITETDGMNEYSVRGMSPEYGMVRYPQFTALKRC